MDFISLEEIQEKAQQHQAFNKHVHYLGKGGYEAKRMDWRKEDPIAHLWISEAFEPSLTSDDCSDRGFDWVRARVKEKERGDGY